MKIYAAHKHNGSLYITDDKKALSEKLSYSVLGYRAFPCLRNNPYSAL